MKLVIFTGNQRRHRYVANVLTEQFPNSLVVSECQSLQLHSSGSDLIDEHFALRDEAEAVYFAQADYFDSATLPILKGEVNTDTVVSTVDSFKPDMGVVYGASILNEKVLSLLPDNRFINLHLGLSPYYRGSGTNFWPFVNDELWYVGSTILFIDEGVDTGDIITHVRPDFYPKDTVHTVGCKVIRDSAQVLLTILSRFAADLPVTGVKQWSASSERYYRRKDFDEVALTHYYQNLKSGMIEQYIATDKPKIRLVELEV